jgi:hypothetical protein
MCSANTRVSYAKERSVPLELVEASFTTPLSLSELGQDKRTPLLLPPIASPIRPSRLFAPILSGHHGFQMSDFHTTLKRAPNAKRSSYTTKSGAATPSTVLACAVLKEIIINILRT